MNFALHTPILTYKLNPSVSNAAWVDKREGIQEHTVLRVNHHLVTNWPDEWNEDTIAERGSWLSEKASDVWAGPDSSFWCISRGTASLIR
ncbi:GmrSD restriction endonuclease domain-containing protein [Halorubrum sp. DTA98]|uniref:GmrSD restriction endonuclease domain-containing protein n=1 Tax=Halorubrum sp. DTA98 TaxID=3402163 RepID=UPI003AAA3E64